jgi:hypothetical protein
MRQLFELLIMVLVMMTCSAAGLGAITVAELAIPHLHAPDFLLPLLHMIAIAGGIGICWGLWHALDWLIRRQQSAHS